jgi:hypothetical protein
MQVAQLTSSLTATQVSSLQLYSSVLRVWNEPLNTAVLLPEFMMNNCSTTHAVQLYHATV